jgi:hypothetical protein
LTLLIMIDCCLMSNVSTLSDVLSNVNPPIMIDCCLMSNVSTLSDVLSNHDRWVDITEYI